MSLAQPATLRAGVLGSPVGGNLQKGLVGLFIGVHTLFHQPPRRLQSQAESQKLTGVYECLLLQFDHAERGIITSELPQFHS
ncbi:hypothetical protein DFAR_2910032 [Desulfarculales bacterium]